MKLHIRNQACEVGASLGLGGEGEVLRLNAEYCVKLFENEFRTEEREAKVRRLAEVFSSYPSDRVAFPLDLAYMEDKSWSGYTMAAISNAVPLKNILYSQDDGLIRNRGMGDTHELTLTEAVKLCIESFAIVEGLHGLKMVVGDLNDGNILVNTNPLRVVFIDVDSFQLEGEPCQVVMEEFLDPYLKARSKTLSGKYFFTPQSDIYALGLIWFKVLFGIDPYSGPCMINGRPAMPHERRISGLTPLRNWSDRRKRRPPTSTPIGDDAGVAQRAEILSRQFPELMTFFDDLFVEGARGSLVHYYHSKHSWQQCIRPVIHPFVKAQTGRKVQVSGTPYRDLTGGSDPTILERFLDQYGLNLQSS